MVVVAVLLLLPLAVVVQAEVYSSVADMQKVFLLERNIVTELADLAEKMRTKLERIDK